MALIFPKVNFENVKAVLIDLDDTLYDFEQAQQIALTKCWKFYCETIAPITQPAFNQGYFEARSLVRKKLSPYGACRSRLIAFQYWFEMLGFSRAYILAAQFENLYWDSLIDAMILDARAKLFLQEAKSRALPIAIITDMQPHIQVKKILKLGIKDMIDFLISSDEAGAEKPASAPFESALKKLDMQAGQVIMIGDNPINDIQGAEKLAIKHYQVTHENR